jgi:hypothetical protein
MSVLHRSRFFNAMRSFRTWSLVVVSSVVILVATVVAVNVIVDAYGIRRRDFSYQFQEVNMNYVKMNFLLRHPHKYDSFILGSSRAEKIDPTKIAVGRYYCLTYPLGVPKEHLDNIKLLLRRGVKIRNLLIALDDFSSRVDPADRITNLLLQPHPAISGKPLITFYGEYYCKLKQFFGQLKEYIRFNFIRRNDPERTKYIFDLFNSGRILCPTCDDEIERDVEKHVKSSVFDRLVISSEGNNLKNVVATMREIVALARQNGINLVILINPIHRLAYLTTDLAQFAEFKRELASITDYYDFSGLNSITTNNYYYYETSHYRSIVGDMMLKVIFGSPSVSVPPGFGVHVTAATVARHLLEQCREIRSVRTGFNLSDMNRAYADSCEDARNVQSRRAGES